MRTGRKVPAFGKRNESEKKRSQGQESLGFGRRIRSSGHRSIHTRMSIRRTILALLVGILVTIAISWLAMFIPTGNQWYGPPATTDVGLFSEEDDIKIWRITRGDNTWHSVVVYWHYQISGMSIMMRIEDYEAGKFDYRELPAHFRPDTLHDLNMNAWFHATGWPFKAMHVWVQWERQVSNADIIYEVRGGWQLPRDRAFNPRAVPLTPIWSGFLGNVLIYAVLWLLLMWAVRAARQKLRKRDDQCRKCGYLRTGLAPDARCPECGHAPPTEA